MYERVVLSRTAGSIFLVRSRAHTWPGLVGSLVACVHVEARGCACGFAPPKLAARLVLGHGDLRRRSRELRRGGGGSARLLKMVPIEWTAGMGGWMDGTECAVGALLWLLLLPLEVCMSCCSIVVVDALVSCLLRSL